MTNSKGNPLTFGFRPNEAKLSAYKAFWDNFNTDLYKEVITVKLNSLNR